MISALPVHAAVDPRLRTTSVCVAVAFGARHDPAGLGGLAHLLEHAVMSGHEPDGRSLSEHVERIGGHANAETGLESMLFYVQVHADDADDAARRLLHAVVDPHLDDAVLTAERGAVLQELAAARADPSDLVQDLFLGRLFAGHPLGRPVGGTDGEVGAIDLAVLRTEHRKTFLTAPTAVFAAGPRLPAPLLGNPPVAGPPARPEHRPLAALDRTPPSWPGEFTWISIGSRAPATAAEQPAYEVLSHLLGGSSCSMLYRRLRLDDQLAYMFQSWNRAYTEAGAWRVLAGAEPENCERLVSVVTETLTELADRGPAEEDLLAARRQAGMRLVVDMESPLDHVRLLGQRWGTGRGLDPLRDVAELRGVTVADVRRAAGTIAANLVVAAAPVPQ